ncbi:Upstream stimulatory factor 1 [Bagarius yarrelli]|uniref:Upstream stimulatory factor 1 n=1 Tax=Bagarius yarrelli TaxID=175774 RepID=A0A556VU62_BAGYA|nr:Upstream stimulatory factor 1 [Bagarius yarrelli]
MRKDEKEKFLHFSRQQKSPDSDCNVPVIEEGIVATAEDPSAITTIQSAATFSSEQPIKYLFKTEGAGGQVGELYPPIGQVTYRVIQVADGQLEAQTDGATASEALEGDGTETHYTYYPAAISDGGTGAMVTGVQASDTILSQGTPTVERRRRDKINNWIVQLSKTIPDCTLDATKTGQSKGGILSKACDYIQELRQSNNRLAEELNTLDRLRMDNQLLRQEVEDWKSKNQILRSQLRQHGIVAAASAEPQ